MDIARARIEAVLAATRAQLDQARLRVAALTGATQALEQILAEDKADTPPAAEQQPAA